MSIIDDLTIARRAAGLRQADLAAKAGVSRAAIQKMESRNVDPRLSSVEVQARALGMDLMLVPAGLREEVRHFIASGGKFLGRPPGIDAPLSIVDQIRAKVRNKAEDAAHPATASPTRHKYATMKRVRLKTVRSSEDKDKAK